MKVDLFHSALRGLAGVLRMAKSSKDACRHYGCHASSL